MKTVCAAGLLAASITALPGPANAASLMQACKSEIAVNCSGVAKGRGRISACLMAHEDKLSGACKGEVAKVRNSRLFRKYIPGGFESLRGWQHQPDLRRTCASDVSKYCPSVKAGKGRILACLYSRSNSVSKACSSRARMVALGQ
jgi:hypothetical protein